MTTQPDRSNGGDSPIGREGWGQLERLYEWLRSADGERVASSWLGRRGLPKDLVDEVLGESFSVLIDWIRQHGPFAESDLVVPRLGTFAITKRGAPNVVRRRGGRRPEAPLSAEGDDRDYVETLPDMNPAIDRTPELALLALAQEHQNGRVSARGYAAAQYFLSRHFGILERPSWIQSEPAGGTTEIERLIWETFEYLKGGTLERPISQKTRDEKRRLWVEMGKVLRKILA